MGSVAMSSAVLVAVAVVWVLCAIQAAVSARQRGHDWTGWFVCGVFVGPLAWCFAMSLTDYRRGEAD